MSDNNLPIVPERKPKAPAENLPARQQDLKNEMPEGVKNLLNIFPASAQTKIMAAAEEIFKSLNKNEKAEWTQPISEAQYDGSLEAQIRELDSFLYYNQGALGQIEHRLFSDILVSLKELGLQRMIAQKRLNQEGA